MTPNADADPRVALGDQRLVGRDDVPPEPEEARQLYEAAASSGCALGSMRAGVLAALGVGGERSWPAALDFLVGAASAGHRGAQRQLLLLSKRRDFAGKGPAAWRRLRSEVEIDAWLTPPPSRRLSATPAISAVAGFATKPVCRWLMARAAEGLGQAFVNDPVTGQLRPDEGRTARNHVFNLLATDLIVLVMQERLARACRLDVHLHEAPSVLSYEVGQQYKPHFDFVDPTAPQFSSELSMLGQRVFTCLTYLNEDYLGGDTHFPEIGLRFRGKTGDALMFSNVRGDAQPDPLTLHAGLPPTRGRKWLLSQWVRDQVQPI